MGYRAIYKGKTKWLGFIGVPIIEKSDDRNGAIRIKVNGQVKSLSQVWGG